MTQTTFDILNGAGDCYAKRNRDNWSLIDSGTFASHDADDPNNILVERSWSGSIDYYIGHGYLRFDTSSIPDGATITAAELQIYVISKVVTDGLSLLGDYYDFGGTPAVAADWVHTPPGGAASSLISALTAAAVNTLTLSNLASINKTGYTGIRLGISARAADAAPTGNNEVVISSYEGPSQAAKLVVTYDTVTLDSALPDADVTTTGWTSTPLYSKVNDASDATVIQATAS